MQPANADLRSVLPTARHLSCGLAP